MLEQIDVTEAREALLTVRRRVEQYAWLMNALHTRDISEDRHFRRAWLNHFKLRDKDREFCRFCFRWLEETIGGEMLLTRNGFFADAAGNGAYEVPAAAQETLDRYAALEWELVYGTDSR